MTDASVRAEWRRIFWYALPIVICVHSFCAIASDAQSRVPRPIVVLEAIDTVRGIGGYKNDELLVRLTGDGKVQWDKWVGRAWKRQTSSLSAERMSETERSLDAIDHSGLRASMGPYYVYTDTETELRIRMATSRGELTFSVLNPWSGLSTRKPMPKNVKTIVCEISRLRAQVAKEPIDHHLCGTGNTK